MAHACMANALLLGHRSELVEISRAEDRDARSFEERRRRAPPMHRSKGWSRGVWAMPWVEPTSLGWKVVITTEMATCQSSVPLSGSAARNVVSALPAMSVTKPPKIDRAGRGPMPGAARSLTLAESHFEARRLGGRQGQRSETRRARGKTGSGGEVVRRLDPSTGAKACCEPAPGRAATKTRRASASVADRPLMTTRSESRPGPNPTLVVVDNESSVMDKLGTAGRLVGASTLPQYFGERDIGMRGFAQATAVLKGRGLPFRIPHQRRRHATRESAKTRVFPARQDGLGISVGKRHDAPPAAPNPWSLAPSAPASRPSRHMVSIFFGREH